MLLPVCGCRHLEAVERKTREHVCRNACTRYYLIADAGPGVVFHGKEHAFNPAVGMLHLKHLKVMFLNMAHNVSYFTIA